MWGELYPISRCWRGTGWSQYIRRTHLSLSFVLLPAPNQPCAAEPDCLLVLSRFLQ